MRSSLFARKHTARNLEGLPFREGCYNCIEDRQNGVLVALGTRVVLVQANEALDAFVC